MNKPESTNHGTTLLMLTDIADHTGLAINTLRTYSYSNKLPAPDAAVNRGRYPLWETATIDAWMAGRVETARTPKSQRDEPAPVEAPAKLDEVKPLEKMTKAQLADEFEAITGDRPGSRWSKAELVAQVQARQ